LEYLFTSWPRILQDIRNARHVLLLSDFDGTLTPIVEHPEMAVLSPKISRLLHILNSKHHVTVGIISGRALADLKHKVNIDGLIYAGNHGLEIEGPGISFTNPVAEELRPILRVIHYVLTKTLSQVKGVLVENKGLSLSVHYRMVDKKNVQDVDNLVKKIVGTAEINGKAKLTSGKKVYEVRPGVDWDKGTAIKLLMKRYGKGGWKSGLLPVYLGDDSTDEDAFKVIEAYGRGVSVFVGDENKKSKARYYLKSHEEVGQFLEKLIGTVGEFGLENTTENDTGVAFLKYQSGCVVDD
jgi:trehalose 6-phosphate phosphatase